MPMYECGVMVSMSYSVLLEAESVAHARDLAADMVDDLGGVTADADIEVDVTELHSGDILR